jgi:Asp/Glu/hydantoin racemase
VIGGGPLAHAAQDIAARLQRRVVDPVCAAVRLACARAGLTA